MAKPAMIIDVLSRGDDEESDSLEDREPAREGRRDPEALIADIESQLAELRRAIADAG